MKHKRYDDLAVLYIYGELGGNELNEFEAHLSTCAICKQYIHGAKQFNSLLNNYEYVSANEKLLQEARARLSGSFIPAETSLSFRDRFLDFIYDHKPGFKPVLAGALMLLIGFLGGFLITRSASDEMRSTTLSSSSKTVSLGEPLSPSPRISNVRFIDSDDADGEIEFTFDAVMPVRLKGGVNDPDVQKILATALISEQNPGIRLQSVNAITSYERISKLDDELKEALISAVRYDKNPGVRREALLALQSYQTDPGVRQALLDVLAHDESAGLRISALNILTGWTNEHIRGDSSFVKLLKIKINSDSNDYIRMRSHAILKEIQQ